MQATTTRPLRDADAFLAAAGWSGAARTCIAGDASFRTYERVTHEGKQAVLMDAPPPQEDVRPFVTVSRLLEAQGFQVPGIVYADEAQGFLLLKDLGDVSFTRYLQDHPEQEGSLYRAANEVLLAYRDITPAALPLYDHATLMREAMLFSEWFLPQVMAKDQLAGCAEDYNHLWDRLLTEYPPHMKHFVHRDFHADNLMWLADRDETDRVGQLDFQDALKGDTAYDLVSLLEDARRDIAAETVGAVLARYIEDSGEDRDDFIQRYALLGAQRNCKIIGIFMRLCIRDHKPHYLTCLPRVWGHLERDVTHPVLTPLKQWLDEHIPAEHRGVISP